MSEALRTTNHEVIRAWVEARKGRPAVVRDSGKGAILRVDFGQDDEQLQPVEWDEFFRILDANNLAFLHQDLTESGTTSLVSRFVERN
ncbi:hypothetical protein FJV76_19200 [Mesorhizobium sp. WSM4303]|uniref:hypothetical protein n=1 Tax=unclassified Mesorhizobium TaxID=325217 RepID=UPI00115EF15D|nr:MULTISPECIES: hypothetical protein [unclassified Mesorhizobium]TRC93114.1 hypothetical protein FJV77_23110 [Mesorhizobium sp. WSM4306]TRD02370.1 hypothetical protein FJV76_19200 [Mesorhizobium sp. WSM4303]